MTVARALTLENTEAGLRIISNPVDELKKLQAATHSLGTIAFSDTLEVSERLPFSTSTFSIEGEIKTIQGQGFIIELSNENNEKVLVGFDGDKNQYFIDRRNAGPIDFSAGFSGIHYAPRFTSGSTFSVKLLIDVASVEFFADGGKTVMTDVFFPEQKFNRIRLISGGGELLVPFLKVHELKSIYKPEL